MFLASGLLLVAFVSSGLGDARVTPSFIAAQQNSNSISGHVIDNNHRGLSDLRVELLNEVDSVIQTTRTDGSGLFVFRKLSDGTFQVRVLTHGTSYVSQTKRVEVVRPLGFGAMSEQVEIVLRSEDATSEPANRGVVFVQDVPASARKEFEKATALLKKQDQQTEAYATLTKAIEIFPQYYDALELLGVEYVKTQQYGPAVPILAKAVEVNTRGYASWYALGVAQYHLKQSPAALESLQRSVLLNPRSINSHLWLGIVLRMGGRLEEAEKSLRTADRLGESKLPDAHWQLALLFNQMKRYREAADQLELFLKVTPDARDAEQIKKLIKRLREM